MTRKRLITRLKWYYPTEKFNSLVLFPLILGYAWYTQPLNDILLLTYGMLVCILILNQGQLYWKVKLDRLMKVPVDEKKYLGYFRDSRRINIILIALMPLVLLIQLMILNWAFLTIKAFYLGVLANIFAILEYINYYHVQLMIDNKHDLAYLARNKKLKRASLAKDLIENSI